MPRGNPKVVQAVDTAVSVNEGERLEQQVVGNVDGKLLPVIT